MPLEHFIGSTQANEFKWVPIIMPDKVLHDKGISYWNIHFIKIQHCVKILNDQSYYNRECRNTQFMLHLFGAMISYLNISIEGCFRYVQVNGKLDSRMPSQCKSMLKICLPSSAWNPGQILGFDGHCSSLQLTYFIPACNLAGLKIPLPEIDSLATDYVCSCTCCQTPYKPKFLVKVFPTCAIIK